MAAEPGPNREAGDCASAGVLAAQREEPATEGARRPMRERAARGRGRGRRSMLRAQRVREVSAKVGLLAARAGAGKSRSGAERARMLPPPKGAPAHVVRGSDRQTLPAAGIKREGPEKPFQAAVGPRMSPGGRREPKYRRPYGAGPGSPADTTVGRSHARKAAKCAGIPASPCRPGFFDRAAGNELSLRPILPGGKRPQKSPPWHTQRGLFHGRSRKRRYPFAAARAPEPLRGRASPGTVSY